MYLDQQIPDQCIQLWQQCQQWVPLILKGSTAKTQDLVIASESLLEKPAESVYLIKEGILNETHEGRVILCYEDGDLLGADGLLIPKDTQFESDFSVIVDEYDGTALLDQIAGDKQCFLAWSRYLSCLTQANQILMSYYSKQETAFHPEFREYAAGDIIIHEGAEDKEVFTLLSGSAKAMIGDTVVGEVKDDEIFGAIAALTGTQRTASIVAATDCSALVVQSDRFRGLLAARPNTVTKLIEDMARTIVSSNEKIVELTKIK